MVISPVSSRFCNQCSVASTLNGMAPVAFENVCRCRGLCSSRPCTWRTGATILRRSPSRRQPYPEQRQHGQSYPQAAQGNAQAATQHSAGHGFPDLGPIPNNGTFPLVIYPQSAHGGTENHDGLTPDCPALRRWHWPAGACGSWRSWIVDFQWLRRGHSDGRVSVRPP